MPYHEEMSSTRLIRRRPSLRRVSRHLSQAEEGLETVGAADSNGHKTRQLHTHPSLIILTQGPGFREHAENITKALVCCVDGGNKED